jgi:hypothetical protein
MYAGCYAKSLHYSDTPKRMAYMTYPTHCTTMRVLRIWAPCDSAPLGRSMAASPSLSGLNDCSVVCRQRGGR